MHPFQSILWATDFRPASLDASETAMEFASAFGSKLTLFHVFQPVGRSTALRTEQLALVEWQMQELAQQLAVKNIAATAAPIAEGHPVLQILREAEEMEADLILIGAGKWAGQEPFSAGPIAESVLQHARQNVLAVRPGMAQPMFHRILCPVDQSAASAQGVRRAITLARVFHSKIHIVTVVPEISWLAASAETGKLVGALAEHKHLWQQEFTHFLNQIDMEGVPRTHEIRHGVPYEEILASAHEHQSDLIVMGSMYRGGLARLFQGSVSRRVLQRLPCSLLTIKDEVLGSEMLEDDLKQVRLLLAEGREFLGASDYRTALQKFRQALAYDPFQSDALEGQAVAYDRLGKHEHAEECRRRARRMQRCAV